MRCILSVQLTDVAFAVMDQIQSDKRMDAERNQKIIRIIFAGVMEMILTGVEDSRRERSALYVPKFSAFVKFLSAGSGTCIHLHVNERCRTKEEKSKQGHTNNKAKQHSIPKAVNFPKKN